MIKILLFYKYLDVQYPQKLAKEQRALCESLNLKGRIIVATEGINATLSGSIENIDTYLVAMRQNPDFADIDFKESLENCTEADAFPRLSVKVKEEIVRLGKSPQELSYKDAGTELSPEEWHAKLQENNPNLVLIDTRNVYETRVGKFENAIIPPLESFREFDQYLDENLESYKDKDILMYCTGGVRCVRATALLKSKGIEKVSHLRGGIVRYTEQFPEGKFRGKNYVFDGRVTTRINQDIISNCDLCQKPCDDYENCLNALCNKHFITCKECAIKYNRCCSTTCQELILSGKAKVRPRFRGEKPQEIMPQE